MPLDLDAVKTEIRGRLGDPNTSDLPAEELDRAVAASLREVSRYKPLRKQVSIALIEGQEDYTLEEGAILAVRVTAGRTSPLFVPRDVIRKEDQWDREYRAQVDERASRYTFLGWVVQTSEGPVLRISPEPPVDLTAVAEICFVRTVDDLDDVSDRESLVMYGMAECLEFMGRKRNKKVRQIPTATGVLKLDDGADFLREGKELKEEFRCRMGQHLTLIERF
jgi:hypothetical protein